MDLSRLYKLINEAQENFENDKVIFDGHYEWPLQCVLRCADDGFVVISFLGGEETYRTDVFATQKEALDAYIANCQQEDAYSDLIADMLYDENNFMDNDASQYVLNSFKSMLLQEAFLTKQDKQILLDSGHKEEDLEQIQQAADKRKTTYTIDGKDATREDVIKLLGREKYLHGLSRSAFHHTASQKQDGKEVGFDSSKLFESEEV
jgi:hypothetical protein